MTPDASWSPRDAYRDIRAYAVDPAHCELELADNTSQRGAPPGALRVMREAVGDRLSHYPTTYSFPLREAIASYIGVTADEILVGAGSDEVMSCAFRALGNPGDMVAYMDPTFVMTRVFAATNSLIPLAIPLGSDNDADAEALVAAGARLTYVCTPNNPTGVLVARPSLDRVLADARGLVVVDEAYAEYAGTNVAREAPAHGRMLVLRTFSKAFGLAGMRVGFAVGARALIAELEKARGPYTVTSLGERAALAALTEDVPWLERGVAAVRECRDGFATALRAAGFAPLPSAANFVLVPVRDAEAAMVGLRQRGILVRHFTGLAGIGDALRITIASAAVMERVLVALQETGVEPANDRQPAGEI
jgi:histidinol-phosphate aminotransferase